MAASGPRPRLLRSVVELGLGLLVLVLLGQMGSALEPIEDARLQDFVVAIASTTDRMPLIEASR